MRSVRQTQGAQDRREPSEDFACSKQIDHRTKQQRQADKRAVTDERRAIKKSARQQLKKELLKDLGSVG